MDTPVDLDPKDYVSTLDLLRKIDFLQGVPEDELKNVLFSLQKQIFEPNRTILFQGEIANRLFIIQKGRVVITTKAKGQKAVLADLKPPMYFGEISLLRPTGATANATAGDEGADLIILTHDAMTELSSKVPDISKRIQSVIENRLAERNKLNEADEPAEPAR